jgi:hypothetical protein
MTATEKIKIKQILFSFFLSIITIPIYWLLLNWIFVPKDYISDGPTDFSLGIFTTLIIPVLWGFTLIFLLVLSRKIFKQPIEND